jgi:hypothetical protein
MSNNQDYKLDEYDIEQLVKLFEILAKIEKSLEPTTSE